jgi:flagellar protein FliL
MTDRALDADADLSADSDLPPVGGGGRKKLLVLAALVLLLLLAVGAGFAFGLPQKLFGGGHSATQPSPEEKQTPKQAVFFDLPDLLVNLNASGKKASFLKISISLELEQQTDVPRVQAVLPRIIDNFQVYLRELRAEDLKGSAGMYRLREELLRRVNDAAAPAKVNDVLFKEMLVQ